MKRLLILFTLLLTLMAGRSFGQENCTNNLDDDGDGLVDCRDGDCPGKVCEICDNGVDDDGDRFIDCFDKECTIDPACEGFFLGKDATCEVKPDSFPPFQMKLKFKSPTKLANHINRLIVGDVDDDGVPEIVTTYRNENNPTVSALNFLQAPGAGTTLALDKSIDILADGFRATFEDIAMADIDRDGCAEIFVLTAVTDGNNYAIIAYDCNGTKIWTDAIAYGTYPGTMGLADFDGDGLVELYTRTQVYDAHTGAKLGENNIDNTETGIHTGVNLGWGMNSNQTIAVDIDGASPGLELIAGCRIYSVNIDRGAMTATVSLIKERPEYATRTGRTSGSGTSVADFNQDGSLDVLAVGSYNAYNATTTIFFWDVKNDQLKTYTDMSGSGDYNKGWKNGAGRINIADIDGDTLMNAVYVSGKFLYALKETASGLDTLWRQRVTEETSGYTGCTMFDFNADGKSEIVYRDEDYIYIYTTTNVAGTVSVVKSPPVRCASRTSNEYPIVVDMDGDGSTEICVTCAVDEGTLGKNHSLYSDAEVRVFESANVPWVPARKLWNQHGYFVTNVNDDLSIPRVQQLHHLAYAQFAQCRLNGTSRPLNSFLNQSPYLNSFGCPSFASPNLSFAPFSDDFEISVNPPTCPDENFTVSFKFTNRGDIGLAGDLPVSFYDGDPNATGATRLGTMIIPLSDMLPGDTLLQANAAVNGPGSAFTLYIVLNDDGTTVPTPIRLPNSGILECDYTDNVLSVPVNPLPAAISASLIRDNLHCATGLPGAPAPQDNGAVKAHVPIGAVQDSVNFNFYWSDGSTAKPLPADFTGSVYSGLAADTYTVYAVHKTVGCGSDTTDVAVGVTVPAVDVKISIENIYDNCETANGELKAVVNDTDNDGVGDPVGNFTYIWYDGPLILTGDTLGVSHTLAGLSPGSYSVLVFDKATGCPGNDSEDIIDQSTKPVVDTTHVDIVCSNLASGSASASVGGATTGFTFYWYDGNFRKPTADFTGPDYTGLTAGNYTVVAEDNVSKCESDSVIVTVRQTAFPIVTMGAKTDQTSCDPARPNGSASASVTGGPAGYTFQWFAGQNINPPVLRTGASATGLKSGIYTVKVTDDATGCFATDTVHILNKIMIGALNLVPTPMTRCEPFNGAVTATPTVGSAADYKYTWYNGKTIKALSDYPDDTTNVLAGLAEGFYTVKAVNRTTFCETPAKFAEVQNLTPSINITVIPNPAKYPTDCNAKNGEISATITIAGNVGGFTVDWYKSNNAAPIGLDSLKKHQVLAGSPAVDVLSNVSTGFYSINVTNADDNCKDSKVYFLPSLSSDSLTVSATDASDCNPVNGQFTAELLIKAGNPFTKDDYIVELYKLGTNVPVYSIVGTSNPGNTFNFPPAGQPLDTGRYYVVAVGNPGRPFGNSICTIAGGTQEINFSVIEPTLALDSMANTHCAAAVAPDGQVIANLATGPVPHNFEFFTGANNLDVADRIQNSASNTLTGQLGGFYTVQLTADNGCTAVSSIFVPTDTATVTADITALPRTLCDTENGSIQINSVQEITSTGSVVAPFTTAAYTVTWYDSTSTGVLSDPVAATANMLENLKQNEYFVEIINDVTGCKTSKILTEVEDGREYPAFDLVSFMNPTSCLKGATGPDIDPATGQRLGHLEINVTTTSAGGFAFNWYTGDPKTLPPLANHTTLLSGLTTAETYTVEVIDNANNCPKEEVYTVPLESIPLTLSASAAPVTNCLNPDGRLNAIVTSAGNAFADYHYNWFIGTAVTPPASFTGRFIDQASFNTYLIVATDQLDPACEVRDTVVVEDGRIFPVVTAGVLNPLTICDVTKPDGTAFAAVGNNVIDYTFEWYGENITPPPFASGSQISSLSDSTYTVIATNIVSLCSDTTQVQINFMPLPVPMPAIEILSHVTNCDPDIPNGALAVSVGGNTTDYIFNWYDGLARKISPDFEGVIYDSLAVNDYSVIAIDRVTLCESPLVSKRIEFQPVYPRFVIDVEPTLCGLATGAIFLTITNDVEVTGMEWFVGESLTAAENSTTVVETGPVVLDADNGFYRVDIFTPTGCDTTGYVEIKNEINPYNGISRNGDQQNSYFHINCIEDFPSNVVKIFNRNGTLVFEGQGYDNTATLFDGVSNKGISPLGNNLPDGTYFYIIDKKDGSKPIAGYLEIVN